MQMEIYNDIYSWDGKRHGSRDPIAWFAGSYNLQIHNLEDDNQSVTHLKQFLCIYSETGIGHSISAHPEKFAKHVCEDFSLDLERVLWVEKLVNVDTRYEVIVYSKSNRLGDNLFYEVTKRPPTGAELALITKIEESHDNTDEQPGKD
jgi:hypothetical protein